MKTQIDDIRKILKPRDPNGHKGTFGHALLIAGSHGMAGAAILGATAALRSGMGKLIVYTPECNLPILQIGIPEVVVCTTLPKNLGEMPIAIGPGIGMNDDAKQVLHTVLSCKPQRFVIDADGLNLLAAMPDWPSMLPLNTILTPHPKEWQRLINADTMEKSAALVQECAQRYSLYIILKGHRSTVCTPQGETYTNTTGNSGMATAGSGDVLTGILLSLLAQGYSHKEACRMAVWLHGKAGDEAAALLTPQAMIASDIVHHLPDAFKALGIIQTTE